MTRWPVPTGWRRQRLLEWLGVDVLFDVGANVGQYATEVRNGGYRGQIVSFEPVETAFRGLEEAAQNDPRWAVRRVALGATPGEAEINVAGVGSVSSSFLPMTQRYMDRLPGARYVGTESIRIETLDLATADFLESSARVGAKMDVQGYELEVVRGGPEILRRAVFVESELAFVELYHGQAGFEQLTNAFYEAGLRLAWLEPALIDQRTGALLGGDGIFVRDP